MIPIRLNLLSPEKRRWHQRATYVQFTKNMLEVIFLALCVSSIILLYGQYILQNQFRDVSASLMIAESKYVQKNREVDRINDDIRRTERLQQEYALWSPVMTALFQTVPAAVALGSVTLDKTAKSLSIKGLAATRSNLLEFKSNLSTLPWLAPFELPPSALTAKELVPFSLTVTIKL